MTAGSNFLLQWGKVHKGEEKEVVGLLETVTVTVVLEMEMEKIIA